jgi:hypothetical protein
MLSELRHALRVLLKAPVFSALVVAVLAVGYCATTTMFSVVNSVLLKPLPFATRTVDRIAGSASMLIGSVAVIALLLAAVGLSA